MAGNGNSGGHNRLSAADHLLRGTYDPAKHGPLNAKGTSVADVLTAPEHLQGDARSAWLELAGRYNAATTDPARIEVAAIALATIRKAHAALNRHAEVPVAETGKVLRVIARFSDVLKGALSGQRVIDRTAAAPTHDPFAEFDEPASTREGAQ